MLNVEVPDGETGSGSAASTGLRANVLLVYAHASFREGVASALEAEPDLDVVAQAGPLAEARQALAAERTVDVAVIDLGLPDGYGAEIIEYLRATNPQAQALVCSATDERAEIARAVNLGTTRLLHRSAGMDEILEAVRRLRDGDSLLPLEEVLSLIVEVLKASEIVERLYTSAETERNHVASILSRPGIHSRLQAVIFAARHGAVEIGATVHGRATSLPRISGPRLIRARRRSPTGA